MSHSPQVCYTESQDLPIRVLHLDCRQEVFVILAEVIRVFGVTGTTLHDLIPSPTLE